MPPEYWRINAAILWLSLGSKPSMIKVGEAGFIWLIHKGGKVNQSP
jgi:hypothetical protein